jgi:hypothetical protein
MKTALVITLIMVFLVAVSYSQESMASLLIENSEESVEANEIISEGSVPSESDVS